MSDRPNILMIMSDEHDPAVMGCYGDSIVQTPHMDRLAEEGIVFDAAYTTSPLCAPARASFTAVQYVSRCGVWTNDCQLPSDDYPSLPHALNAVGYECWLGGKMHFAGAHRYGFRDVYPGANDWDGESLLNYLDDGNSEWRDIAVSEYYAHNIASGMAMIRQGPWKYVYHARFDEVHGPERELYNLEEDAGEFNNLANDPAQADRIAQLHALLARELRRDPEDAEAQSRADLAKGY